MIVGHLTRKASWESADHSGSSNGEEVVDEDGQRKWIDEPDKVQGIILLRKNEHSIPALRRTC